VLLVALPFVLLAGVGVFHTAARVSVVKAGYELGRAEARYRELLRENEHLKVERATLRSAPRLEAIARARLGMAPPSASQIIVIQPAAARASTPVALPASAFAAISRPTQTRNP
jgi:cell division protein FtsL